MEDQSAPGEAPQAGHTRPEPSPHPALLEAERGELAGAISMVANGWAAHVLLCGLHSSEALIEALAQPAEAAGVSLRIDRIHNGCSDILVGRSGA